MDVLVGHGVVVVGGGEVEQGYEQLVRAYIVPGLGTKNLVRLQAPDLRTFLNKVKATCQCCALGKDARRAEQSRRCCARRPRECCGSYLGDGTIRYIHRVIRVALQDAVLDGILTQNVAKNLRLNYRYRPRFKALTAEEAKALLQAARGDRLFALYAVALALGLHAVVRLWGCAGRMSTSTPGCSASAWPFTGLVAGSNSVR